MPPPDAIAPAPEVDLPAQPPDQILSASDKRHLVLLIAFSFFMQMLDSTIINTATPSIALALNVAPLSLKSALTSYMLAVAVFIPISAWLADRYGTRRVFGFAIAVFTLGSIACGLAQSLWMLTAARVIQGIGGAMMMPVGRLALVRSFDKAEFVNAISTATIPGLIGPALGPLLGGFFSVYLSWRMIFFVNIPFGLIALWLTPRLMPDYRAAAKVPLDLAGFVLFASAIGSVSWALEAVTDGAYLPALVSGALGAVLFYAYLSRKAVVAPIVDLRLLRIASFRISFEGGFATRLGVGGIYFLLTLLFQVGFGFSAIQAGLLQVPQAIAMILMRFFVGSIIKHRGYRQILLWNTALAGVSIMLFATITASTPLWLVCVQMFAYGFVMSLQYAAMNTLGFIDLAAPQASMGSSMSSTAQNLSMSLGIAFASLLMSMFIGGTHDGPHYVAAFRVTTLLLGLITLISALLFVRLPRPASAG